MHEHDSFFDHLLSQKPKFLAGNLFSEAVVAKNLQYFNKPPLLGQATTPHQDGFYFMLEPCHALTMWLALDDVDEENGYVRGSHARGMRPHGRTETLGFSQGVTDFGGEGDHREEIACTAKSGDLLAHHALTIHRADANTSATRSRRALGFIYYAESAREDVTTHRAYKQKLKNELAEVREIYMKKNMQMKKLLTTLGIASALLGQVAVADKSMPRGYTIPTIDLAGQTHRQTVVDREKGQYLGHPTTVLLEDGRTMLIVYPKGHGRGGIVYKRSRDGGRNWSKRLPTPKSWETSKEVPTIHRVVDAKGKKRLIMWSGLYPARLAVSEDDGEKWSELKPVGDWGGIVVMGCLEELKTGKGHYMAMFHDDGRFFTETDKRVNPVVFNLYKTYSKDGGLTWSKPESIFARSDVHLCEPGIIRSPDGKQLCVLLRENSRRKNSFVIFSNDEGRTWTKPRELSAALTGDRHTGKYTADGRLFISFRDRTHESPTPGDWVAWVGTYDDIVKGREGQYRVRLMDNTKGADCAYPPVEILPDDTLVTTTYGHWTKCELPYIVSVRLKLSELDALAKEKDFLK